MQQNNCTPFSLSTTHTSSMRCEAQMLSLPPFLDEFVGQADFAPTHLRVCQGRHFVVAEVVNC